MSLFYFKKPLLILFQKALQERSQNPPSKPGTTNRSNSFDRDAPEYDDDPDYNDPESSKHNSSKAVGSAPVRTDEDEESQRKRERSVRSSPTEVYITFY